MYYKRGFGGRGWLPILVVFLAFAVLFSGGFHRAWLFIWPLFCAIPFVFGAGFVLLSMMRWSHGDWSKFKNHQPFEAEKPKRGGDTGSDIYYV